MLCILLNYRSFSVRELGMLLPRTSSTKNSKSRRITIITIKGVDKNIGLDERRFWKMESDVFSVYGGVETVLPVPKEIPLKTLVRFEVVKKIRLEELSERCKQNSFPSAEYIADMKNIFKVRPSRLCYQACGEEVELF